MTNLRLPGQYDERLLGSLGLQGPYYNWNRWYLPGVGTYLELDPIARQGGFNSEYGPSWYPYAEANPLRYTDRAGRGFEGGGHTPPGGGREDCAYYDERCKEGKVACPGPDPYACRAGDCCRKFDESDEARCARVCLVEEDRDCVRLHGGGWWCRMRAHRKCYRTCDFGGSWSNFSWTCIRTGLNF